MHRRAFIQSVTLSPLLAGARAEGVPGAVAAPPLAANDFVSETLKVGDVHAPPVRPPK